MQEVVIWAEQQGNRLLPVSLELLEKARELAGDINGRVSAVLIGHQCRPLAEELICYGAAQVFLADDPRLALYQSDLYPKILARILSGIAPEIVLIGGTSIGLDLAPRVAAKLKTGLTAHCVDLFMDKIEGKDLLIHVVPGWSGNLMIKIICPDCRPQMATVRPGIMEMGERDPSRQGAIIPVVPEISDREMRARTVRFVAGEVGGGSIDEVEIIVSGGFGLKSTDGFGLIEELAKAIHGEVAGTRPAYDQGWIPEYRMIGQSGKTVRPKLFMSIGASGALHYTTGFLKSRVIVGIDRNPRAPIFTVADLGVVGDLRKIIPSLIEELEKDKQ
jgi:electron transfer flavoprotein alpha subunit